MRVKVGWRYSYLGNQVHIYKVVLPDFGGSLSPKVDQLLGRISPPPRFLLKKGVCHKIEKLLNNRFTVSEYFFRGWWCRNPLVFERQVLVRVQASPTILEVPMHTSCLIMYPHQPSVIQSLIGVWYHGCRITGESSRMTNHCDPHLPGIKQPANITLDWKLLEGTK